MTRRHCILFGAVWLALGFGGVTWADEIYLKNGDRLTGEIESMEDETLKVKVFFGDDDQTIEIEWKNVKRLVAEKPLDVELYPKGLEREEDKIYVTTRISVTTLEDAESLPLAQVEGINKPEVRYKANTSLGGNRTSGNTDTAAVNFSLDSTVWSKRHRGNLGFKYNFAQAEGRTTADNSRALLKYDYFVTKKMFGSVYQLFEQDKFQGLNLRSTTAAGVGRQFIDKSGHKLEGLLGLGGVYQDFELTGKTTTPAWVWALRWEYDLIKDNLELWHRQQGARDALNRQAWRLNADQGIRVSLWDDFYFNLEFDFRFNSQPEPGKQQTDEALIFCLGYAASK